VEPRKEPPIRNSRIGVLIVYVIFPLYLILVLLI
jgi:hypothetical protein